MKDHLNDLEIAKIEQFCKDEAMYNAVKKVLFAVLYADGVVTADSNLKQTNATFSLIANSYAEGKEIPSNEILGQALRAKFEGVHTILNGFEELKTIKSKVEEIPSPYNEAI